MNYCPFCMNEIPAGETVCPACGRDTKEYRSPSHTLARGAMLNHRYLVGGVLGEGGFGITYIGMDTLLQFKVAIKEFYPAGMVNRNNNVSNEVMSISADTAQELFSKSREHFLHEARTLAKFTNEPGIVAVRDFFEENRTVYIVMEYLDGITLKSYLKQVGTISSYNTVCLLMPVFRSLKKIHEKNLIHRDISPDNIMLVGEAVKLLDFGAAREFADEKSLSVMLKHGYAPMEQYRRHGKQGAWTDIYAICATMYKCITGSIPPDAPDRIYEDNIRMPSELGFDCSPEFEAVLRHGLAIKAEDRIRSIDQLLAELSQVPGFDIDINGDGGRTTASVFISEADGATKGGEDPEGSRLSQYIPRSSYDDDSGKTVAPAQPAFKPDPGSIAPDSDDDRRLSEYIPSKPSKEPEPAPEKPAPKPSEPEPAPEKKSKKLPVVIASVAAAAAIAVGVIIFLSGKDGSSVKTDSSGETKPQTSATAAPIISGAETSAPSATETAAPAAADTAAPTATETAPPETAPAETDTAAPDSSSESPHLHIIYPELRGTVDVNNDGCLTMNYALFDFKRSSVQTLFGTGTLPVTTEHDRWTKGDTVMLVPVDLGNETADYFDSIDLYFKGDQLYTVQFESGSEFNDDIKQKAIAAFGTPYSESENDVRWVIRSGQCMYQIYMQEYDGEKHFTQRYIYKTMLYEEKMLEDGYFEKG